MCYAVNEVYLFRKRKITTAGLKKDADDPADRTWTSEQWRYLPKQRVTLAFLTMRVISRLKLKINQFVKRISVSPSFLSKTKNKE
jgi:hypothetical protein